MMNNKFRYITIKVNPTQEDIRDAELEVQRHNIDAGKTLFGKNWDIIIQDSILINEKVLHIVERY